MVALQRKQAQIHWEDNVIDYVVNLLDVSILYYILSVDIAVMVGFATKRLEMSFLTGYCFFILSITLLSRTATDGLHFEPRLFWSYEESSLREQILFNVVGFVPIGLIGGRILSWKIIPVAATLSAVIEILQLVSMRGLFESDDIIHNTSGLWSDMGYVLLREEYGYQHIE